MKKHYRHENNCLNCGTMLEGKYCHNCGQENLEIKESFGHMMNHAISDYFHFDHQFFHTLKPLFLKPGMLTNEYMAGRRAQFLHPVKMYIFISLVYFVLVFQDHREEKKVEHTRVTNGSIAGQMKKEISVDIEKDADLTPEQKQLMLDKLKATSGYHVKKQVKKLAAGKTGEDNIGPNIVLKDSTYAEYLVNQSKLPADKRDGWFKRYTTQKAYALNDPKVNKAELISEGLKHNFPKMMFFLLPILALIIRIAFWENHKYYVEHLIYAFHLHCFIFLFLSLIMIIQLLMPYSWWNVIADTVLLIEIAIISWYVYRSLRVVYQRSKFRTITKMTGVFLAYSFAFIICLSALVLFTTAMVV